MRVYLKFSLFLIFSLVFSAYGNEIFTNELCGSSSKKSRPCHYVKKLNFHLDGNLHGKELFHVLSLYLNKRVAEMNEMFSQLGVHAEYKPFTGSAWVRRPKEKDSNIELTFLLTETPDKEFIIITFYTFSKGPFYIRTSLCASKKNECVIAQMQSFIDEIVVKSIIQDGN